MNDSTNQRNRLKQAGILIYIFFIKYIYNYLSATDQLSRKQLFWNSARVTPHYKQLFRETENQRNRFKNAGIFILFKKFYNFLSATDQLSRKLLFWNSARGTPHYKQLFRETEKQIENWYKI